ncbi:ribonuclease H-like domain-containing protein [Tanacetum coccineum]
MAEVLINSLDAGNPLYLQNNDHSNLPIVGFKLIGSENYKMWSTAMKVALKGKNNIGFIDGTCVKPVTSVVLAQQWERCNAIVLGWILGSLSQELYLGQVYSKIASEVWDELEETYDKMDGYVILNVAQKIYLFKTRGLAPGKISAKNPAAFVTKANNGNNNFNNSKRVNTNNNINRGPNLNLVCKHCCLIGLTIERCYELNGYPVGFKRNPYLSKQSSFVKKFCSNNVDVSQNAFTSSGTMSASFTNEQMMKLLNLINEKPVVNVSGSMAGKMPCFFNNSTYFNLHIDKFFCAKSNDVDPTSIDQIP